MARLQRTGPAARRGRERPAAGAPASFCAIYEDNLDEFYMVRVAGLHDQVEGKIDARGADGVSPAEVITRIRDRAIELRERLGSTFADDLGPKLAEHGIRVLTLGKATTSRTRGDRQDLRQPGLPGADAARHRPRPPVPLHLQPLAQHRGPAPEPREGRRGDRAGQGAEGAAPPLRRARRQRGHVCPDGGGDRRQPRRALPRDGDRPSLALPGHPGHRLRRQRRGRRHAPGRRGGGAPPTLRRGGAARGRIGHGAAAAGACWSTR